MVRPKSKITFWVIVAAFIAVCLFSICSRAQDGNGLIDTEIYFEQPVMAVFGDSYVVVHMLGANQMPPYVIRINEPNTVEALYVNGAQLDLTPKPDTTAVFMAGISVGLLLSIMMMVRL